MLRRPRLRFIRPARSRERDAPNGRRIDQAQAERALHFAAPGVLDFSVNGRVVRGVANDDEHYFPHGVFACTGRDRWVAIACATTATGASCAPKCAATT